MVYDAADPDARSAGSFFTNPILGPAAVTAALRRIRAVAGTDAHIPQYPAVQDGQPATKLSAAWLIERAGFPRGYPLVARARGSERADARIAISSRHTLAITNRGGGSAAEVVALAAEIRDGVADAFGVRLEPEPILIGLRI